MKTEMSKTNYRKDFFICIIWRDKSGFSVKTVTCETHQPTYLNQHTDGVSCMSTIFSVQYRLSLILWFDITVRVLITSYGGTGYFDCTVLAYRSWSCKLERCKISNNKKKPCASKIVIGLPVTNSG